MLPFISARSTRGGSFAAGPAAPAVATAEVTRQSDLTAWWKCESVAEEIGGYDMTLANGGAFVDTVGGGPDGSTKAFKGDGTNDGMYSEPFDLGADDAISLCVWMRNPSNANKYVSDTYGFVSLIRAADTSGDPDYTPSSGSLTGGRSYHSALSFTLNQGSAQRMQVGGTFDTAGHNNMQVVKTYYHSGAGAATFDSPAIAPTAPAYDDAGSWKSEDWELWVVTWASGDKVKMYRGSALAQTDFGTSGEYYDPPTLINQSASDITDTLTVTSDVVLMAGSNLFTTSAANASDNYFDDIRIYQVALSTSEINEIYNAGAGDW